MAAAEPTAPVVPAPGAAEAGAETPASEPDAAVTPEPLSMPAQVGVRGAGIAEWLPPDQLLWLEVTDERFPARYRAELTGRPRGVVLLLHDAGHHPSWPRTIAALFDELPLHGWHTLAIALPAPATLAAVVSPATTVEAAEPSAPEADASEDSAAAPAITAAEPAAPVTEPAPAASTEAVAEEEPAATETPPTPAPRPDPEVLAHARIVAALAHLRQSAPDAGIVLAGFGDGALRAVRFTAELDDPAAVAALILVDVPLLDAADAAAINAQLGTLSMPLLDIRQGNDSLAAYQAELRQQATMRQRGRLHTQLQLPPAVAADSATPLARRVRGWLQRWLASF